MKIAVIPAVLAAGIALAPMAQADGSQASLSNAVQQVYTQVQIKCTPNMPPHFQTIQLTGNGSGRIIDANPRLGGEFQYMWVPNGSPGVPGASYYRVDANDGNGIWFINLEFC
jgi:hypothetical protein